MLIVLSSLSDLIVSSLMLEAHLDFRDHLPVN